MAGLGSRLSCTVHVVCVLLLAVACFTATPVNGQSFPAAFHNWLTRLRALVEKAPKVSCFLVKGRRTAQLYENVGTKWDGRAGSSKTWTNYHSSKVKGVAVSAKQGGVILSSFNAHAYGSGTFHARFTFGGVAPFRDDWGTYYAYTTGHHWTPFNFVQMFSIPCGNSSSKVNVRLQTRAPAWGVNAAGITAALLPPPSFLSSLRSSAVSGKTAQAPFENLSHTIKVSSKKALLVMAANGRIKGSSGATSLTYSVDGHLPTNQHGQDYGFYHLRKGAGNRHSYVHMGLYQLAEVSGGSHKIQLQGKGSNFDLQYATSQVAVIPVDNIQLKTKTADWTMMLSKDSKKTLLEALVVAPTDSLVVMTSNFEVGSKCSSYHLYMYYKINNKFDFSASRHGQFSYNYHVHWTSKVPFPGSYMRIAKVKKGIHRIALAAMFPTPCTLLVRRAALQVGIIPQSF